MLAHELHGHIFHNRFLAKEGQVSCREYGFGIRQLHTAGIYFTGPEDFVCSGCLGILHGCLICRTEGIVITKEIDTVAAAQ